MNHGLNQELFCLALMVQERHFLVVWSCVKREKALIHRWIGNRPPTRFAGTGIGAVAGGAADAVATGAAIGTIAGPIGTLAGAAVGAIVGGVAGNLIAK